MRRHSGTLARPPPLPARSPAARPLVPLHPLVPPLSMSADIEELSQEYTDVMQQRMGSAALTYRHEDGMNYRPVYQPLGLLLVFVCFCLHDPLVCVAFNVACPGAAAPPPPRACLVRLLRAWAAHQPRAALFIRLPS